MSNLLSFFCVSTVYCGEKLKDIEVILKNLTLFVGLGVIPTP
jgi:hypothetical protein